MIDVPTDVQQIADQGDPRFQGANTTPVMPGTQMPVAPLAAGPAPTAPNVGQNAPPTAPHPVDRLADAFLTNLISRMPPPPQQPGSFASKLKSATDSVGASLGDAAAAGKDLAPGQGWLTGVEKTLAARNARISGQKQQDFENQQATERAAREDAVAKQGMAESNIRMLHQQKLLHQLDESNIAADVAEGTKAVAALSSAPQPGNVVGKDLTSDEMHSMLAQKQLDPSTVTPYPTGRKQVGTDKDGNPTYATTYTLMTMPKSITLDDTNRLLLKGVPGYDDMKAGTVLSGTQYNQLFQQAADIRTATAARDKSLADADIAKDATDKALESVKLGPDWNNALAHAKNDPIAALKEMQNNPDLRAKYPHLATDVMNSYGGPKVWNDIREKQIADDLAQQKEDQKEIDAQKSAMADINVAMTDEMKQKIAALPQDKRAVLESTPKDAQAALLSAAFGPGDLDFDRIFPPRLTKGAPGMTAQQAIGVIKQLNPNWDAQQYKLTAKAYKDVTSGTSGRDIGMYNNVLQHAEEASDVMMEGYRKAPKLWNTAVNTIESEFGGEQASRIKSALLPVKEEYALLMSAGYKPGDEEMKAYNTLINDSATPGQISAALKVMAAVGAVRLSNINQQYKRVSGKNIPGILTTDSAAAAKRLGLDDLTMARLNSLNVGDTLFHNENYKPPTAAEVQAQEQQKQSTIDAARVARGGSAQGGAAPNAPQGATPNLQPDKALDGTSVWHMLDGSIQDAAGNKYNPQTGKRQ